ncbi:DUF2541 family protein [Endozoicomonadaceae bacterium StTr2]
MSKKTLMKLLLGGLLAGIANISLAAGWLYLGDEIVYRTDNEATIRVDSSRSFSKLQFKVKGVPLHFSRMAVKYRNGQSRIIPIKTFVPSGSSTGFIDLPKGGAIEQVTFLYSAQGPGDLRATVALWGESI